MNSSHGSRGNPARPASGRNRPRTGPAGPCPRWTPALLWSMLAAADRAGHREAVEGIVARLAGGEAGA